MANKLLNPAEAGRRLLAKVIGNDEESFRRIYDPNHISTPQEQSFCRPLSKTTTRYIIVGAQNATPVVPEWWAILNTIAADKGAELLVVPIRYKNPTSVWTMSQRNAEVWAGEVKPYLWNQRYAFNKNLTLVADMKIQPTTGNPLGRLDGMSGVHSAIFAHPKLQMRTVPVPSGRMAKILTTTGVCTKENYTDSGLGKISQFHHSLSAIYVELDGPKFYLTQLHFNKDTNTCTDLDTIYSAESRGQAPRAAALVSGDLHVRFMDPRVQKARARLIDQIDPEHWMFHDTLDSHSTTPHHLMHPLIQHAIGEAGMDDVRAETDQALDYINDARLERKVVLVPSNHDDMLTRWVERHMCNGSSSLSKKNARFFHELAIKCEDTAFYDPEKGVAIPDAFGVLAKERFKKGGDVIVLDRGESFSLAGVELGMHGDIGANGARGSRQNIRRIGVKSIIGHSHSPGIDEGCYQTGTSTYLRLEYNHGASGWLNADVVLNADGKRQVIVYIDGKYRS